MSPALMAMIRVTALALPGTPKAPHSGWPLMLWAWHSAVSAVRHKADAGKMYRNLLRIAGSLRRSRRHHRARLHGASTALLHARAVNPAGLQRSRRNPLGAASSFLNSATSREK